MKKIDHFENRNKILEINTISELKVSVFDYKHPPYPQKNPSPSPVLANYICPNNRSHNSFLKK